MEILYNSNITNCMTIGIAHEFEHPRVDDFVYGRAAKISRRLGYDY